MPINVNLPLLPDFDTELQLIWNDTPEVLLEKVLRSHKALICAPGRFLLDLESELFEKLIGNISKYMLNDVITNLPENPKILSIGSGTGILEQWLSMYRTDAHFYLFDGDAWTIDDNLIGVGPVFSTESDRIYNYFSIFQDSLASSPQLDPSKFTQLNIGDQWPTDVDFIYSIVAAGFTFPLSLYANEIKNSLKTNGTFITQVINNNIDEIEIINSLLNNTPIKKDVPLINYYSNRVDVVKIDNTLGKVCKWIKN